MLTVSSSMARSCTCTHIYCTLLLQHTTAAVLAGPASSCNPFDALCCAVLCYAVLCCGVDWCIRCFSSVQAFKLVNYSYECLSRDPIDLPLYQCMRCRGWTSPWLPAQVALLAIFLFVRSSCARLHGAAELTVLLCRQWVSWTPGHVV
jgi:hypothetical protein